jgi:lipopolysaccharide export system ATP-binding protein
MSKLSAKGLVKSYGNRIVVNKIDLEINPGEVVGLLGPNGAGKTTTFYIIVGLIWPEEGKIVLNGEDISRCPMYIRARKGLNYLPQEPSIFRKLSVEENIMAILENLDMDEKERKRRLEFPTWQRRTHIHYQAVRGGGLKLQGLSLRLPSTFSWMSRLQGLILLQ